MKFFNKKDKKNNIQPRVAQTVTGYSFNNPFNAFNSYIPLNNSQHLLYASLREAIPIIDSAINKLVRLLGMFEVKTGNKRVDQELQHFLDNIKTGGNNTGFKCFISSYFDSLLTYGTAVAEIVPYKDYSGIYGVYNANNEDILLQSKPDNPFELEVCVRDSNGSVQAVKNQNLILITSLNPQPDKIGGTSILQGLPFVSDILLKIFTSIGQNWERAGNIRYAVTYNPPNDGTDGVYTQQRAEMIASEWSKAMQGGGVSDFVAVGDVNIKVIGADNQILDCQTPGRLILEQIVSKLSIPPFLLGLSWSSTERMSSQQADILTSELEHYRYLLNPVISKLCSMWLAMNGYSTQHEILWSNINLQDEVELANARLINSQAEQLENNKE
ncbi:MAG: phage portal protein [Clostridia bacterium]|nr:phage portal protein [Clostridia bacterium]MEE1124498.1 serine/threonine protein phosphatase [Acutalibacteraceae bacterium]